MLCTIDRVDCKTELPLWVKQSEMPQVVTKGTAVLSTCASASYIKMGSCHLIETGLQLNNPKQKCKSLLVGRVQVVRL